MLQSLLKGIGGLARDTIKLGESLVVGVVDYGHRIDDLIANAPKLIEEGYHEGLFTSGDTPTDPTKVNPEDVRTKPVEPTGFNKPTDPTE